jgi:hypothetical protein
MIVQLDFEFIITHGLKRMPYHYVTDLGILQLSHCPLKRTIKERILPIVKCGKSKGVRINKRFVSLGEIERRKYPATKVFAETIYCPF